MKYWLIALLLIIAAYFLGYVNGCNSVHCPQVVDQTHPKEILPSKQDSGVVKPTGTAIVLKKKFSKSHRTHVVPSIHTNNDITFDLPPGEQTLCDELLKEYYSIHYFHKQYVDSAMEITITDSISENQIKYRHVDYVRLNMLQPPSLVKKQIFALSTGVSVNTIAGPGIGGDIEWERLRVGVDWYPVNRSYTGRVGYVLFRK